MYLVVGTNFITPRKSVYLGAGENWTFSVCTRDYMHQGTRTFTLGFLPKTGIPGHFGAKPGTSKYILKPSTNHTPGAQRLDSLTSYLFLACKGQVHLVLSTLSSFNCFGPILSQSEAMH